MNRAILSSQNDLFGQAMFTRLSGEAGKYITGTDLSFRLGSGGEQSKDLLVVGVFHRSPLTPPGGLTLVDSQDVVDDTGITQTLSVFSKVLVAADLGKLQQFTQALPDRMGMVYSVYRPVNALGTISMVAKAKSALANTASPWPYASVTATKPGQLMVVLQTRVSAMTTDRYTGDAPLLQSSEPVGARLLMAHRNYNSDPVAAGDALTDGDLIPDTSVASISAVFDVDPVQAPVAQSVVLRSDANGVTLDITESGRLMTVRNTASATQWHKTSGTKSHTWYDLNGPGQWYFEAEVVTAPAAGPSMAIGVAYDAEVTGSGPNGGTGAYEAGKRDRRQFFSDGTFRNPSTGDYVAFGPAWAVGDIIGVGVSQFMIRDIDGQFPRAVFLRLYINGVMVGETFMDVMPDGTSMAGFISEYPIVPHLCCYGPNGKLRVNPTLKRLPPGYKPW